MLTHVRVVVFILFLYCVARSSCGITATVIDLVLCNFLPALCFITLWVCVEVLCSVVLACLLPAPCDVALAVW